MQDCNPVIIALSIEALQEMPNHTDNNATYDYERARINVIET